MQTSLRLLLAVWVTAWMGAPLLSAAPVSAKKKQAATKPSTSSTKSVPPADKDPSTNKDTSASDSKPKSAADKTAAKDKDDDEAAVTPTHALVSTLSIEDIRGFEQYPKQIQSLVQSCLALTHLELGYLYGSHEPSKGGMDCSGTIYHVLHFQGLKDVPRQSDEMCNWVEKKSQLHLTPTATSFDSDEFTALKPGDLLFWTSPTETTRKLPVTHVMVYLGKLKKTGKRIVFGSSDGRSYMGERRSGVSVFDFSLPQPGSTKHFYGYGPTPGLLPPEPKPTEPERPVIAAMTPAPAPATKETPTVKETTVVKETPSPKVLASVNPKTSAPKDSPVATVKEPAEPKEEVRKAVAVNTDTPPESAAKKTTVAESKADAPAKTSTTSKPKAATTKKRSNAVASSTTRRRTPAAPPKSAFEQRVDRAVSSVRRFFQQ